MQENKVNSGIRLANFLLFFLLFIFHYTGAINISIKNAVPILLIPLLVAFSMFNSFSRSAFYGILIGICMDSVASGVICFNAIVMFLISSLVFYTSNHLFNKNIKSAILISLLASLFYYILKWIVLYAFFVSIDDNLVYLLHFAFPSMLYTSIFIIPFYFLYKKFYKMENR